MIYWFALGFIIVSLAVISVVIFRKFPQLVIIDIETMVREKQAKIKEDILLKRVARKAKERGKPLLTAGTEIKRGVGGFFERAYGRAKDLEKKYALERQTAKPSKTKPGAVDRIKLLVDEADKFFSEDRLREAEEKFIEVISLDHHNIDAYRGLGRVYFKTKQFEQAKETLDFIIKLKKADDRVYDILGEIAYHEGDYNAAKDYYLKALGKKTGAVSYHLALAKAYAALGDREAAQTTLMEAREFEPKNPKTLDFLVENSIILGKKEQAKKFLKEYSALNADNPKLAELKEKITKIK